MSDTADGASRSGPVPTGLGPLVGVLALQGGVAEHVRALSQVGARTRLVRRPDELEGLDGIVVPGGESSVLDKLSRAFGLAGPLREALVAGLPALATCAGLLLLADELSDAAPGQRTLGVLHVRARRNAFGVQLDSFETRLALAGVGEDVEAVFIRAPVIDSVAAGVEPLARVDGQIVAVRQGAITALSFHPELTGDLRVHRAFVDRLRRGAVVGARREELAAG
ncbi:MAG: pyridoxal 5'-phosphate synthase glutaminase subunit PdxT [Propionibacterium sp.]